MSRYSQGTILRIATCPPHKEGRASTAEAVSPGISRCKSQGIILITAIFIVFLISTLGIGYLAFVSNQIEMAGVGLKSAKAFYYAETGISAVILYLKEISNWEELAGVLISGNFDEGEYKVEVVSVISPSKIKIKSTGNMSNFQRIIEVTLDKETVPGKIIQQDWKEV